MDNLDDSENNAKISDSAYSNSCSNSQSRRSHSSKSTHSGSNSSGSSGYGGKPSTSGSSNTLGQLPKKEKDSKKKKPAHPETLVTDENTETDEHPPQPPLFVAPQEEIRDVEQTSPVHAQFDNAVENMEISNLDRKSAKDEDATCSMSLVCAPSNIAGPTSSFCSDGFSCVISMHNGVVMYTTSSLTTTLGFPKEMWIGRSFIDFVHPRDRSTFASQITSGLAVPKNGNGTQEKVTVIPAAQTPPNSVSTMVCRIRKYRGLMSGYGVKENSVTFMPFLLNLSFKNISDEDGKVIYLVIQATPFFSAFKVSNERLTKAFPFVIRHAANGNIEYIDSESVPYLGYLPQDLIATNAMQLYHPDDLFYLRQVYETIVKEGGLPRCKPYRMVTQNGDYVKLETEWSSFINPWSRKLEFVIGKHHIIEGPSNPDVFQPSEIVKPTKAAEEVRHKTQKLRERIIRIMHEVRTKPAELAKQQMSKRCQELATFMESLMEDQPRTDDDLRVDIQDPDHSYYERDSVMLGGISPHHEYNDSKSSTETPLSYNQLNYNETLQRYFDSHQPYSYEDYNTVTGENVLGMKETLPLLNQCYSPMAQNSGDSGDFTSSSESAGRLVACINSPALSRDHPPRLTESLLNKHNSEMEKELMKIHRETRSSSKGEREKASNESRQKKKEHLARCNASFQPTSVANSPNENKSHGLKRSSKHHDESGSSHKHHCSAPRLSRRRQRTSSTSAAIAQPTSTITTGAPAAPWPTNVMSNMNTFIVGLGIPPQMGMGPVATMPGMFPLYYAPSITNPIPSTSENGPSNATQHHFQPQPMHCMFYGHPVYGAPLMYSPINQLPYPMHQSVAGQTSQRSNNFNPLTLATRNYEEACKPSPPKMSTTWRDWKRADTQATSSQVNFRIVENHNSTKALNRSTEAVPDNPLSRQLGKPGRMGNNEDVVDKTDGESSYSSFYSSFFKTESGSADDSGDAKKGEASKANRVWSPMDTSSAYFEPQAKKVAKRKAQPPWLDQVCLTSELIYKYQILTKSLDDVLSSDKQKMDKMEQPSLVNEQLGQLYMDLQLEGVAARLTLEEGITSSSSSGEETSTSAPKEPRRKREYSKLVMIYEEDAPLPPPPAEEARSSSTL